MSTSVNWKYINVFSVPIQKTKLELNIDSLIKFCYEIKRKDEQGITLSNMGGWQSPNIANETHTEFIELKNKIEDAANIYHRDLKFKKIYKQKIDNIWVNINQKGHANFPHRHPHTMFSGVFYLTNTHSTPISFIHPYRDINTHYWDMSIIEEKNELNSAEGSIPQFPNELLIFPAWVEHKVHTHRENTDRITISFNTNCMETEHRTAKLYGDNT